MRTVTTATLLLLLAIAAQGCADTATCGEGQERTQDFCVPTEGAGSGGGMGNGMGNGMGDGADAGPDADTPADNWGEPCQDDENHSDCEGVADYCSIMPGADTGYCSATGCLEDTALCPDGWECFDLSVFGDGLPAFCAQP